MKVGDLVQFKSFEEILALYNENGIFTGEQLLEKNLVEELPYPKDKNYFYCKIDGPYRSIGGDVLEEEKLSNKTVEILSIDVFDERSKEKGWSKISRRLFEIESEGISNFFPEAVFFTTEDKLEILLDDK